jgi:hypothetical protein
MQSEVRSRTHEQSFASNGVLYANLSLKKPNTNQRGFEMSLSLTYCSQ